MSSSKATQDLIRERLSLSDIVGKRVKLKRAGKEFSGLCPFHGEKTPSFTVNNQKGFYHCFGCGAHGDVFTFLMQDENLSFPEALEKAADMAGVKIEKSATSGLGLSRVQIEYKDRLFQLLRHSTDYFAANLQGQSGYEARRYFEKRRLETETLQRFSLGYALYKGDALLSYLTQQGFSVQEMLDAGVVTRNEETGDIYDKFRDRLIFPILNTKNQVTGFGGRAIKPDQKPKYLNSPETQLFHKGRQLYNQLNAINARGSEDVLLIVEGYMDAIKLSQAGYTRVVASLGTALTEEQIQLCWKMEACPVVVMDGDQAGLRAQKRVIERVLPFITAEKTLSFLTLPEALDPDAFVALYGIRSFRSLLATRKVLVDQIWQVFYEDEQRTTPEQKSKAESGLLELIQTIRDPLVRQNYTYEYKQRLFRFKQASRTPKKAGISYEKASRTSFSQATQYLTVQILIFLTVNYPALIEAYEEEFASLNLPEPYNQIQSKCLFLCAEGQATNKSWYKLLLEDEAFRPILTRLDTHFIRSHLPILLDNPSQETLYEIWNKVIQDIHKKEQMKLITQAKQQFEANPTEENWQRYADFLTKHFP